LRKSFGITIPKLETQRALALVRRLKLVDNTLELARTDSTVLIPLVAEPTPDNVNEIKQLFRDAQIGQHYFQEIKAKVQNLSEFMRTQIPEELLPSVPSSFDIIGDIAIVDLPPRLIAFSSAVGEGVMKIDPHVRLVLRKSGQVSGTFRTRKFEAIAGTGSTETVHKEFGCVFHLDVVKVYFNPRLSHERMRVAELVKQSERILDMFAGVGPYSILIAKTRPESKVFAVDISPDAFKYLRHNIFLNRIADRVVCRLGDAAQLATTELRGTADRVIMNLPSESNQFLTAAVQALKREGGTIHYYTFAPRDIDLEEIKRDVQSAIHANGRTVGSFTFSDILKEVAPSRVQVALDVLVS
jgi:tRNA (guanine37-N1)-methyltransferase